jgi:hypothetical protein
MQPTPVAQEVTYPVTTIQLYMIILPFIFLQTRMSSVLFWGGVRLSPLGTSATNWLTVPAQMIDDECGAVGGMRIGKGNRSTRRKPALGPVCPK